MNIKNFFKSIKSKSKMQLISICSSSRVLSNFYYLFFSSAFNREHQSVLLGKMKYLNDVKSDTASIHQLVRNTHRIEKGLLMKPRRNVFALDYISETIDCFDKLWQKYHSKKDEQIKWSKDVLSLYFEVTKGSAFIETQKKRFKSILENKYLEENESKSVPYHNKQITNISYDEFYMLSIQRRSTRWFEDKKVPRDLIDKAITVAIQSPSACNRQPFEYRIIDEKKLLKEIVELPMGTIGYAHNIPAMIVVIGNLDAYFSERDRHLIYIDSSLANMTLMFALETLRLASCPINWPDIENLEKKMQKLLNLEKFQRPIMCLAVGYPDSDGMVASSIKKDLDRIRFYNK